MNIYRNLNYNWIKQGIKKINIFFLFVHLESKGFFLKFNLNLIFFIKLINN